ncbi:DUF2141 domain-containing protein [PVC group bacterium]|nr:DUF2141 domain-containing protein [PVC group bacterium]
MEKLKIIFFGIMTGFFLIPLAQAEDIDYTILLVRVEGMNKHAGMIGVSLFNSPKGYPTRIEHAYEFQWIELEVGQMSIDGECEGIPFGEYAVSVVHDENRNKRLGMGPMGFPTEGVGFLNGQKIVMSVPKFSNSAISLTKMSQDIVIKLDYPQ